MKNGKTSLRYNDRIYMHMYIDFIMIRYICSYNCVKLSCCCYPSPCVHEESKGEFFSQEGRL